VRFGSLFNGTPALLGVDLATVDDAAAANTLPYNRPSRDIVLWETWRATIIDRVGRPVAFRVPPADPAKPHSR
jgi:hypothetical protein